jgi:chromosome segregation ATPase
MRRTRQESADLERSRGEIDEQANELRETQSLLEQQQSQHAAELAELKTSLETREKRRLDNLMILLKGSKLS